MPSFDCLGTHSELCEAMELESDLAEQMGLQSYWSPGKRASGETPQTNRQVFFIAGELIVYTSDSTNS